MKSEPKPIQFRQLLALTRDVLLQDPSIDDCEWKELTKRVLVKGGWAYPLPHELSQAMTQVEQALLKTLGPRPMPQTSTLLSRRRARQPEPPAEGRTNRPVGWDLVSSLVATLSRNSAPSVPAPPAPHETWAIAESEALDAFWRAAQDRTRRLALLQAFAEIALVRDEQWDPAAVRALAAKPETRARLWSGEGCFACAGDRPLQEHHVVQLQHGGSDVARNRVRICHVCHGRIHPWLGSAVERGSWTSLADLVADAPRLLPSRKGGGMNADVEVVWPKPGSHRGGVNGGALLPPRDQKGDPLLLAAPVAWGMSERLTPRRPTGHRVCRVGVRFRTVPTTTGTA